MATTGAGSNPIGYRGMAFFFDLVSFLTQDKPFQDLLAT
jgi:hypothetical protein